METPIPNPFNGAEMFNGQSHHRAPAFDDEDFGPETDVDMVDDVLLSPAIAAAKALVHGADDDFERQRQQMKEFDDPVDLDRSRDTPTPPAHEVARDVSGDNLAESGGEESEEEWNYIPGDDTAAAHPESKQEEDDDMNSQLNPNAAEFVPVSPKRLLMDDPIIASSPARGFEKSLDDIQLPSEREFTSEISERPGDLEYTNGSKHGDDHLDNFSTLHNNIKEFNAPSAPSELAKESIANFNDNIQEHVPFDKLAAMQNMEEKVTSAVLEKANIFGVNNDFSNNTFEATNIFGKRDPMTASFMGDDLPASVGPEDNLFPGTPHSTTVEAPTSPITDEVPAVRHTELDSPVDNFAAETRKSPDLISPGDGPQDGIISGQERTSSSGFESESGADEVEPNVVSNEGVITEQHTKSPTVDLSFTPIQTISDTNPFGAQEVHSSVASLDQFDTPAEAQTESLLLTPKKEIEADNNGDQFDFMQNVASSFVSPRFQAGEPVPFDQLESPKDTPNFAHPPNANSSFLATELPKSPETLDEFDKLSSARSENNETLPNNYKPNVNDLTQDLFSDDTNPEVEETSFSTEKSHHNEVSHVDLDSTEGFLESESKIMQDEFDHDLISKTEHEEINELSEADVLIPSPVCPTAVDKVLAAFDDLKHDEQTPETTHDLQEFSRDSDIGVETKEMKLEFESHITTSEKLPELNDLGENMEEAIKGDVLSKDFIESGQDIDLLSPTKETNPFKVDSDHGPSDVESQNTFSNDFLQAVDQFSAAVNEDVLNSESCNQLSSSQEPHSDVEPEVTRIVSYQTLTPANEPQITKSESYVTGEKEETESSNLEEVFPEKTAVLDEKEVIAVKEETAVPLQTVPVVIESDLKSEPIQSTTVTETLIATLEETSEVPSVATTEVPSSAGTPPPTPAPGLDDSKELQDTPKTDVLVAAVAAAGAVAAGSAILAEKDPKKTKEVAAKKSAVGAKKPDVTGKPSAKTTTTKAPAAKPSVPKTTTTSTTNKSATTAAKPSAVTNKPATAKPSATSTVTKKPSPAPGSKPAAPKPASSAPLKQTTTTMKTVPNKLPLGKTIPTTLKPASKPSTPASKPTTPTTPKAPSVKSDVKSPARPGLKSPLTTKTLSPKPATDKVAEKKPLTNGDIKPIPKKAEVPKRPALTATKPLQNKPAPTTKTAPLAPKTAAPRAPATNAAKPKPASATASKTTSVAANRPSTAPAGKTANGKETVNKQVLRAKPSLNGKAAPAKTLGGVKKTDPKLNAAKPETKPPPIKKPVSEEKKEEEKPNQIQEAALTTTTTNGFADHNEEQESLKIEDLAPMTVETVN